MRGKVTGHVRKDRAFTLIEVLVSLAVFATLSALAYGALSQTLDSVQFLNERMDRLQAIQRTMRLLSEDKSSPFSHGDAYIDAVFM